MRNNAKRNQGRGASQADKKADKARRRLRAEYNAWWRSLFSPAEILAMARGEAREDLQARAMANGWIEWMEKAPLFMTPAEIAFINLSASGEGQKPKAP